ncbi:hypothetical protein PG994_002112 [Apiospora phragmitis]|uniref:F-box domain-containing protein n=1 Tax=Apiospora phragmitis TaxID=2905665 RepID=A0ABR1WVF1_9PEZI
MATEQAQHAVLLEIPELLETILLHLEQRDLLVNAQRVCRQWRQCITETISIQQHLFLLPEPARSTSSNSNAEADADALPAPRPNPLLARHFPEWFKHDQTWPADQRLPFVRTTEPGLRGLDRDRVFPALPGSPDASRPIPTPKRAGANGTEPQLAADRPVTMPELLEMTNLCIHVRPVVRPDGGPAAADGDQQPLPQEMRHSVTRFRVMWGRLSPEVRPSLEANPS